MNRKCCSPVIKYFAALLVWFSCLVSAAENPE